MSGSHIAEEKLEGVHCNSIRDPAFVDLLKEYLKVLSSLLGPKGGTLLIEHEGGLNSFVNSSKDFVHKTRAHHPCLKLINSLMEAQNSMYGGGGLYVGILLLTLLIDFLELELHEGVNNCIIREVFADASDLILSKVEEKPSGIVLRLDIGNLKHAISLVKGVICSKSIGLGQRGKDHFSSVVVEAFLKTIDCSFREGSSDTFGQVLYVTVDGRPTSEACLFTGVLYKLTDSEEAVVSKVIKRTSCKGERDEINSPMLEKLRLYSRNVLLEELSKGVRVVLFNVALAFEDTEAVKVLFRSPEFAREDSINEFDKIVCKKLAFFVKNNRVDIVASQKVISPAIQSCLKKVGVLPLERLGTKTTKALEKLSGCKAVSDLAAFLNAQTQGSDTNREDRVHNQSGLHTASRTEGSFAECIGSLERIDTTEVNGSAFLRLNGSSVSDDGSPVVTMVVPGVLPGVAGVLQALASEALSSLRRVASGGVAWCGAGCGEAWLAMWLRQRLPHCAARPDTDGSSSLPPSCEDNTRAPSSSVSSGCSVVCCCDDVSSVSRRLSRQKTHAAVCKALLKVALLLGRGSAAGECDVFSLRVNRRSGHLHWAEGGGGGGGLSARQEDVDRKRYFHVSDHEAEREDDSDECLFFKPSDQLKRIHSTDTLEHKNEAEVVDNEIILGRCCCGSLVASNQDVIPIKDVLDSSEISTIPVLDENLAECSSGIGDNTVLDDYYARLNALRLSFEGLSQLLELELCVFDQ